MQRFECVTTLARVLAVMVVGVLVMMMQGGCEREHGKAGEAAPKPLAGGGAGKMRIVATTGMVGDLVKRVAGERATVEVLMGAGVDPHLFKPTRSDVAKLSEADMVFYSGLHLEGKMTETFERLMASGKRVHSVTEAIGEKDLRGWGKGGNGSGNAGGDGGGDGQHDPHVWMDPVLWSESVGVIEKKLAAAEPKSAAEFAKNAKALREEIAALHEYSKKVLESVPESSRVLVTAHDAFGYFGRRYNYGVEGVQGISTETEAGVKDIQRLVDLIVQRKIKAVFVESSVSSRNVEALKAGCKAKGHEVSIGGELFSDAMGAAGTYEGTYIGMIDHNVTTIARALGGVVPEKGMSGKLGK